MSIGLWMTPREKAELWRRRSANGGLVVDKETDDHSASRRARRLAVFLNSSAATMKQRAEARPQPRWRQNTQGLLDLEDVSRCESRLTTLPLKRQLLKWIGNKHKFAAQIIARLPTEFGMYYEPFLGSGAVLGTLAPTRGVASDTFVPLMEIWTALKSHPQRLTVWYEERWRLRQELGAQRAYDRIRDSYNARPNGADLLYLSRTCYGGVVRFRKRDGYMSTPCGPHEPISPWAFANRVEEWRSRVRGTQFVLEGYETVMARARAGDVIYCDPPYVHSQRILYGAQDFSLEHLLEIIARCKARGVFVALSIDGTKKSGNVVCDLPIPRGLFRHETRIEIGRSMLKRFQMEGRSLEDHHVSDRLLLTH
ncbi:MAG: Dam family site-specific DNA-(adenine-N6)-methyltransferase [Steroidobacteraceae bacterium]